MTDHAVAESIECYIQAVGVRAGKVHRLTPLRPPQYRPTSKTCFPAQRLLDPKHLVPLRHPFAAGKAPDLELSGAPAHGKMRDRRILGLAGPSRDDAGIADVFSGPARVERLGQSPALIGLQQHAVAGTRFGGLADPVGVTDQVVVADDLHLAADGGGE